MSNGLIIALPKEQMVFIFSYFKGNNSCEKQEAQSICMIRRVSARIDKCSFTLFTPCISNDVCQYTLIIIVRLWNFQDKHACACVCACNMGLSILSKVRVICLSKFR